MKQTVRVVLLWMVAFLSVQLHAAPTNFAGDDMDRFLVDRGLLGRLGQAHQNLRGKASELVVNAMGFLGVPYKVGGTTAETGGFDCSGFVRSIVNQTLGLVLPHNAEQQAAATQFIDQSELRPGDLVFFNTMRRAFSHVGIYIGDGKFIHSPRSGSQVRLESMDMHYWARRFDGARRLMQLDDDNAAMLQH